MTMQNTPSTRRSHHKKKPIEMVTDIPADGESPSITVEPLDGTYNPSFIERMRTRLGISGYADTPPSRVSSRVNKKQADAFIRELAPQLLATLIISTAINAIPKEYSACSPSQEEMLAILRPLFDILSRTVSIHTGASQTSIDLISSTLASATYGVRVYFTWKFIRDHKGTIHEQEVSPNTISPQPETPRPITGSSADGTPNTGNATSPVGHVDDDSRREAERVSALLAQEYRTRSQYGLV